MIKTYGSQPFEKRVNSILSDSNPRYIMEQLQRMLQHVGEDETRAELRKLDRKQRLVIYTMLLSEERRLEREIADIEKQLDLTPPAWAKRFKRPVEAYALWSKKTRRALGFRQLDDNRNERLIDMCEELNQMEVA